MSFRQPDELLAVLPRVVRLAVGIDRNPAGPMGLFFMGKATLPYEKNVLTLKQTCAPGGHTLGDPVLATRQQQPLTRSLPHLAEGSFIERSAMPQYDGTMPATSITRLAYTWSVASRSCSCCVVRSP